MRIKASLLFAFFLAALFGSRALAQPVQQISKWEGHGFHWVPADPSSMRKTLFEVTIPAGHRQVTVAIDDAEGVRVRNLLSMADVTKLGGDPTSGAAQKLSIEWNGLDDRGRALPAGVYRARGLSLPGLKVEFDYSFGNPGNPPWQGYPNSDWGADHEFPNTVAALGGWLFQLLNALVVNAVQQVLAPGTAVKCDGGVEGGRAPEGRERAPRPCHRRRHTRSVLARDPVDRTRCGRRGRVEDPTLTAAVTGRASRRARPPAPPAVRAT